MSSSSIEQGTIVRVLAIGVIIMMVFLLCVVPATLFALTTWTTYNAQFYKPDDIRETCVILGFREDNEFCNSSSRKNYEDFHDALLLVYPPESTSYEVLNNVFNIPIWSADIGTCSGLSVDRRNRCPNPNQCSTDYTCYMDTPAQRVYIFLNSEGRVIDYSIIPSRS
jgi:hypothetical protein